MSVSKKIGMILSAAIIGFCWFKLADRLSISGVLASSRLPRPG